MTMLPSQIISLAIVYSIVYWDADQRKYQSPASLAFVRGIHRGLVNSPHKWSVTRKNVSIWWRHHHKRMHCRVSNATYEWLCFLALRLCYIFLMVRVIFRTISFRVAPVALGDVGITVTMIAMRYRGMWNRLFTTSAYILILLNRRPWRYAEILLQVY